MTRKDVFLAISLAGCEGYPKLCDRSTGVPFDPMEGTNNGEVLGLGLLEDDADELGLTLEFSVGST